MLLKIGDMFGIELLKKKSRLIKKLNIKKL